MTGLRERLLSRWQAGRHGQMKPLEQQGAPRKAALVPGEMPAHKEGTSGYIMFHYLPVSRSERPVRRHHRCVIGFEFRNVSLV